MRVVSEKTKERFLVAAIEELQSHGVSDFSVRRVALACKVSSGAPYKHFADKTEMILCVMRYINGKWAQELEPLLAREDADPRRKLIDISIAYVRFLQRHPAYQTILTMSDTGLTEEQKHTKAQTSEKVLSLVDTYCQSVSMPEEVKIRKLFVIRSLLISGAWLLNARVLPNSEDSLEMIRCCVEREFDLP